MKTAHAEGEGRTSRRLLRWSRCAARHGAESPAATALSGVNGADGLLRCRRDSRQESGRAARGSAHPARRGASLHRYSGQYDKGWIGGKKVRAYRDEDGVPPDSHTEQQCHAVHARRSGRGSMADCMRVLDVWKASNPNDFPNYAGGALGTGRHAKTRRCSSRSRKFGNSERSSHGLHVHVRETGFVWTEERRSHMKTANPCILTINGGSSSIRFAPVSDWRSAEARALWKG